MKTVFTLLTLATALPAAEPLADTWGTAEREENYYRITRITVPEPHFIEPGCFATTPDGKIAIGSRRGDIFIVDGLSLPIPDPTFHKFAAGFDELLGLDWRDGSFYATHAAELTRVTDTDNDGRADRYDTVSDVWGFANYHEYALGSKFDDEGNIWVALGLSKSYYSDALFRGWAFKISADGEATPIASGLRSPLGVGDNGHGVMIYTESQGPWNGSCSLKVLKPSGFMGHPISYNWYEFAPEMGPVPVEPNSPSRMEIERERVKELVPYAVVFPFMRMGRSTSGFVVDETDGKFGPFGGQIFIGDHTISVVMRATMEEVNGVWQGACYPFREGLSTGILNSHFTPAGQLLTGGTTRGWPVRGSRTNILERLDWTGITPFEIKEVTIEPDGFLLEFTKPVDPETASQSENYTMDTFTHIYQSGYGSPEVDQTEPKVLSAKVSDDGLNVRLKVEGVVQGHVHHIKVTDVLSTEKDELLHVDAYYTVNEIPAK
ncbi:hypothetical protein [Roseibacillus persicicus]|uniref:Large, multifunctional secreted protein n=1 Tax=Roseibacillus persicicus TaxID=454148 RepID=A0A918TW49_9BACT|nr:hypothetical protein [Roseibacillus persicicus]GHC63036.1 hypothetical protein GCM10007100_33050 [Roseibacillus persicicus]